MLDYKELCCIRSEFIIHKQSDSVTLTVQKVSPETLKNYGKREYKELVQATFVDTTQATVQETIATTADPKDKESQVEEVDVYEVRRRFNETCKFLYTLFCCVF